MTVYGSAYGGAAAAAPRSRRHGARRPERERESGRSIADLASAIAAFAAGALAVTAVLLKIRDITLAEAHLSSALISVTGLAHSHSVGTAVIYQLGNRWVGFAITGGCSVALLTIPPFVIAALLIGTRRVSWVRGLAAVGSAVVLLVAVNQLRLYIIAAAMQWWGFKTGYERSHVLIGSGLTTIGLALVTLLFMVFLGRGGKRRAA
jgi:exosortase/archaeosortase family protein